MVKVATAAPFKVTYYGFLTTSYIGWRGLLGVFAFFWMGAGLQRWVLNAATLCSLLVARCWLPVRCCLPACRWLLTCYLPPAACR